MSTTIDTEHADHCTILRVGQDRAGHWLVQESHGLMEGRFVSFEAALAYARAERHAFPHAEVAVVRQTLVPLVSFRPLQPDERATARG